VTSKRKQTGYIYRRAGWWVLRYRETIVENGQLVRRHIAKQLAPIPRNCRLKRPPQEIEQQAERLLQDLNSDAYSPEATQTLTEFVETVYLPNIQTQKRASTVKGYRARWASQLKPRCGQIRLRDFRTPDAQRVLADIAKSNPTLRRSTLRHLRSLLSGIFKHAIQQGYLAGANPIREAGTPSAPEGEDSHAYSLEEVTRMLLYLPQPAYTIVAVAAFTGLRRSELRGLMWENYDGQQIHVTRSVWEGHVNEPKTRKSKAPVPVIAPLAKILEAYRVQCGSPDSGPMFSSTRATPLNLNNVLNRLISPAINRCVECRKPRTEHFGAEHKFRRDDSLPAWHGWHSFRRGLATNLYRLGVTDKVIQAILRHSQVSTTMDIYVKSASEESAAAMKQLEAVVALSCADCAPVLANAPAGVIN